MDAICPSCGAQLAKLPVRKTKCKACGNLIFIRYTPDDQTRRLMTQAQADEAEIAWGKHREGVAAEGLRQDLHAASVGDRDSVLRMIARTDGEERVGWKMALIEIDFAKLSAQRIRSVQLVAPRDKKKLCPTCSGLDQTIVSVTAGASAVIPENCTCAVKGMLWFSGWIKRSDGTGYVDFDLTT